MITDTETDGLIKDFTFSDIIAFGISCKTKKTTFNIRPHLWLTSLAELKNPNKVFNN